MDTPGWLTGAKKLCTDITHTQSQCQITVTPAMIILGLGSNLPGPWGDPSDMLSGAIEALEDVGVRVHSRSSFLLSAPFGVTGQPVFANAVVVVEAHPPPRALLARCHRVERMAGRERRKRWGPRTLDIDLLAYHDVIMNRHVRPAPAGAFAPLVLPHPGIEHRPFVLEPLAEIAPRWRHPVTGLTAKTMLSALDTDKGGKIIGGGAAL